MTGGSQVSDQQREPGACMADQPARPWAERESRESALVGGSGTKYNAEKRDRPSLQLAQPQWPVKPREGLRTYIFKG